MIVDGLITRTEIQIHKNDQRITNRPYQYAIRKFTIEIIGNQIELLVQLFENIYITFT